MEQKTKRSVKKKGVKQSYAEGCLAFIEESPSSFHAVDCVVKRLEQEGFVGLKEWEDWQIKTGGKYYVTRNGSSLIAFQLPKKAPAGFHVIASHSDSPSFRLKENPEIAVEEKYIKLNTEPYGGMLYATWLDRCLSVAGRIVYEEKGKLCQKNVRIDEDLLVIPNVAIHINRDSNKGMEYNPQIDLLPLYAGGSEKGSFGKKLAAAAGIEEADILGKDLFLYVREKGRRIGADGEFLLSKRLDDLQCAYASMEGFLQAEPERYAAVYALFDNEEVGSHTKQGAASTFLRDTLELIGEGLSVTGADYKRLLAESFMISADNAHAVHPNHPEKADQTNRPYLNGGIVIKYHGGQKYTTDAYSEAVMKQLCKEAGAKYQTYYNRSDMAGGSTLGNIAMTQVSVPTVDIGLPQLAMHSAVETAGSLDTEYFVNVSRIFFCK